MLKITKRKISLILTLTILFNSIVPLFMTKPVYAAVQGPPDPGGTPTPTPRATQPPSPRFALSGSGCNTTCVSSTTGSYTNIDSCAAAALAQRGNSCDIPIGGNQPLPTDPPDNYTPPPQISPLCSAAGYRCDGNVSQYCTGPGVRPVHEAACGAGGCSITNGRCRVGGITVPNVPGLRWRLDVSNNRCQLDPQGPYTSYENCFAALYPPSSSPLSCNVSGAYRCNGVFSEYCAASGISPVSRETCQYGCRTATGRCRACTPGTCVDGLYKCGADGAEVDTVRFCSGGVICCKNPTLPNREEFQATSDGQCISQGGTVGRCNLSAQETVNCCTPPADAETFLPGMPGGTNEVITVAQCYQKNGYIGQCVANSGQTAYCHPRTIYQCQTYSDVVQTGSGTVVYQPRVCLPTQTGGTCVDTATSPLQQRIRVTPTGTYLLICMNVGNIVNGEAADECSWYKIDDYTMYYDLLYQYMQQNIELLAYGDAFFVCLTSGECLTIDTADLFLQYYNLFPEDVKLRLFWDYVSFHGLDGAIRTLLGDQFNPMEVTVINALAQGVITPAQWDEHMEWLQNCVEQYGSFEACQTNHLIRLVAIATIATIGVAAPGIGLCLAADFVIDEALQDAGFYGQLRDSYGEPMATLLYITFANNLNPCSWLLGPAGEVDNSVLRLIDDPNIKRVTVNGISEGDSVVMYMDASLTQNLNDGEIMTLGIYRDPTTPERVAVAIRNRNLSLGRPEHAISTNLAEAIQSTLPGQETVILAHGTTEGINVGGFYLNESQFAQVLVDSGLQNNARITLVSCNTGTCVAGPGTSFADILVGELEELGVTGVTIRAPAGIATAQTTGTGQNTILLDIVVNSPEGVEPWTVAQ